MRKLIPYLIFLALFGAALLLTRFLYWDKHWLLESCILVALPFGLAAIAGFIYFSLLIDNEV